MSVKKKFDTIDRIVKKFKELQWSESRCCYYLEEFKEVGSTRHYGNEYNFEWGLKSADLFTLEKIEKDLEIEGLSSQDFPDVWNDKNEVLNNTKYIRVFISHLDETKELAKSLADFLANHNIKCFVAHADIKPPLEWPQEIKRALKTMECLISINIKQTPEQKRTLKESAWCMQEVGAAVVRGIPIVIYSTKNQAADIENGSLGFLKDIQYLTGTANKEINRKNILEAIQLDVKIKDRLIEIDNLIKKESQIKEIQIIDVNDDDIPF